MRKQTGSRHGEFCWVARLPPNAPRGCQDKWERSPDIIRRSIHWQTLQLRNPTVTVGDGFQTPAAATYSQQGPGRDAHPTPAITPDNQQPSAEDYPSTFLSALLSEGATEGFPYFLTRGEILDWAGDMSMGEVPSTTLYDRQMNEATQIGDGDWDHAFYFLNKNKGLDGQI